MADATQEQKGEQQKKTFTVTIDGTSFEARPGELLIAAADRQGVYIPRFCWHPRMKPVGMCRMCLVEVEGPRGKALQPACMLPVTDGMKVDTQSPVVKKAQDGVLEFLLINHPLDCPVCDRGGECPLQDQTLAYGPGESRFVEEKRHFEKPIAISELVYLDRERCIQCARCTRFADEIAGDPLIQFVERGNQTQVLTFPDDPFTSYFSGNTVQICPVGALLARPYRFRARPWDLEQVEATCTSCSVGCRVVLQSSGDRMVRKLGVDSDPVNHGWLCDKGRFDYEGFAADDRLRAPLLRGSPSGHSVAGAAGTGGHELVEASWGEALAAAAEGLKRALELGGPGSVAVIGGARGTNEDAYAWAKLAKSVLRTDNVDAQLADGLPAEAVLGLPRATIDDVSSAKVIVALCSDLKEELPVLYLRVKSAVLDGGIPLLELTPQATGLTRYASLSLGYRPGEVGALARALASSASSKEVAGVNAPDLARARDLLSRGDVLVILGRPSVAEAEESVAEAAAVLSRLPGVRFLPALRRGNVHGALDMGLAPGMLPGRVRLDEGGQWFSSAWGGLPQGSGMGTTEILRAAAEGRIRGLVLLGADPLSDFPDRTLARRALAGAGFVVALDLYLTESSRQADVVLPACGWGEKAGTTTNLEGRVSRLAQKVTAPGTCRPDWMIAIELAWRLGGDLGFESLAELWTEVERLAPSHHGLTSELLADVRYRDGIVVPLAGPPPAAAGIASQEAAQVGEAAQARGEPPSVRPAPVVTPPDAGPAMAPLVSEPAAQGASAQQWSPPAAKAPAPEAEPALPASAVDAEAAKLAGSEQEGTAKAAADTQAVGSSPEPGRSQLGGAASPAGGIPPRRPPLVAFRDGAEGADLPRIDAYSLRLVSSRRLYDAGVVVQHAPSLARLAPEPELRAHPSDLDRFGVASGEWVRVVSPRGSLVVRALADAGVPRGSASLPFNSPGDGAADLIDATHRVNDLRIETLNQSATGAPAKGSISSRARRGPR